MDAPAQPVHPSSGRLDRAAPGPASPRAGPPRVGLSLHLLLIPAGAVAAVAARRWRSAGRRRSGRVRPGLRRGPGWRPAGRVGRVATPARAGRLDRAAPRGHGRKGRAAWLLRPARVGHGLPAATPTAAPRALSPAALRRPRGEPA